MHSAAVRASPASRVVFNRHRLVSRLFSSASRGDTYSKEELAQARAFLTGFSVDSIPRNICNVSFSRSSGPGGQNVNKVSSKATLKVALKDLLALVPAPLHHEIRASPHVTGKAEHVVISADDQRKQTANTESCFEKLFSMIKDAGERSIPGETSAETIRRVGRLAAAQRESRLHSKKIQSSKKAARKGGSSGSY